MNTVIAEFFWQFSSGAVLLFILGAYCLIATHNLIRALIGLEILIKAVTLFIILVGYVTGGLGLTQSLVITLIVIEVVIMVVAGGVVLNIFRCYGTIDTRELRKLRG